jgi:hypothetical protein
MTVSDLRAILADAPDDAIVRVNLVRFDGSARVVTDGEYLDPDLWRDEAGVLLQIEGGRDDD